MSTKTDPIEQLHKHHKFLIQGLQQLREASEQKDDKDCLEDTEKALLKRVEKYTNIFKEEIKNCITDDDFSVAFSYGDIPESDDTAPVSAKVEKAESKPSTEPDYEPTPTEKKFVEYYNRILKDYESQSDIEDEIAKWNSGNGQELKRMGMSNIRGVLDVQSELPKLSEDQRGNFYGLREDDYYFVVPISGIDVTQNDAIKQVFERQESGKYLKEVIQPARFQVQAEQDNIITLCSRGKGKISLKDG